MLAFSQISEALDERLWCIHRNNLPKLRRFLIGIGRVLHLSWKQSSEHQLFLRASALTLFSLLAIVPIFATLFGIAKGFGLADLVETQIREVFASQEQVVTLLVSFSKRTLEHSKGGVIAGIGIAILLWTVVRMIGNVESAFNSIWDVDKRRTLLRRLTDYLFLVFLLPLLLVISSSATILLTSGMQTVIYELGLPPDIGAMILIAARFIPGLLLGLGFAFLYVFLPNRWVHPLAALIGGITTAILFLTAQWLYIQLQFALSSYGAIYGSFAALPLFLLWLQAAWILILFGAEFSRAIELRDELEFEPLARALSIDGLFQASTQIGAVLQAALESNDPLPTTEELAEATHLPKGIVRSACEALQNAQIITIDEQKRWVPIVSPKKLEEKELVKLLSSSGKPLPD